MRRLMICTGHVARTGRGQVYTRFWWGNMRERDHLEDPDVDRRIYRKRDAGHELD
jgi:hypothetical protein